MRITEREIGIKAHPTADPWEDICESVPFPEDVSGLRILDVGAGASDAIPHFIDLGADAFALDPLYKSSPDLKGKIRQQLAWVSYSKDERLRRIEALERFMTSFKANRERYKTGVAGEIPFEDNYFDIVYSVAAIFGYLDLDAEILSKSVSECIRVTKPGGRIFLAPYMHLSPTFPEEVNKSRINNQAEMVSGLKDNPMVNEIKEIGDDWYKTLEIVKSSPTSPDVGHGVA